VNIIAFHPSGEADKRPRRNCNHWPKAGLWDPRHGHEVTPVVFGSAVWDHLGRARPSHPASESSSDLAAGAVALAPARCTQVGVSAAVGTRRQPGSPEREVSKAIEASDAVIVVLSNSRESESPTRADLGILNDREYILLDTAMPHEALCRLSAALTQSISHER
jgi:hypothetical protein